MSAAGDPTRALEVFRAELNERLVVHWTGGAWRVPLGRQHLDVTSADGARLGRIVCAEAPDLARAQAGLAAGPVPPLAALEAALAPVAPLLAALRALEGQAGDGWDAGRAARAMARRPAGPVALLSAAAVPAATVVGRLAAAAGQGAIWKPAPGAAASAHLIMRALAPLLGRSVAMLQGGHATGAALAAALPLDWLAPGPVPEPLTSAARVPCRP